ncbi:exonuclease subunit SbcD [uncultured Ilyobacter sp.]|uniref:metallophosphoesterase family protein n=1 Tax=uncultured Ilyobacter sp. TaxID=544433 RepID=UPI002AA92DDD|nr:exonuclease subunit SbcD [uncultured Ilyobacter sp.]
MKILHTSDWHLGKKLEGYSRISEQEKFMENLVRIAEGEEVDMVLVAGDIYDVPNPPSDAERLFYRGVKKLSDGGKRPVVIIPGNHDSADRLAASNPLSREMGIIIFEKPFEKKETGVYGEYKVVSSVKGGVEIDISGKRVYIYALPYPGEKSLGEKFTGSEDTKKQISYSKRIGEILQEGINEKPKGVPGVIMTHIFLTGSSGDGDERSIELGGSMAVNLRDLPDADYIALGHIHRAMYFEKKRAVYSGSPIEYRVSENRYPKKVYTAVLNGELDTEIKGIEVENYKPIKRYCIDGIEKAIEKSESLQGKEEWIYLEIDTDRPLDSSEVRAIKANKNVIEIIPKVRWETNNSFEINEYTPENITKAFKNFYKKNRNTEPSKEIMEVFMKITGEVE